MFRIVIASQELIRLKSLKNQIAKIKTDQAFDVITTRPQELSSKIEGEVRVLIVDLKSVNELIYSFVTQMRQTNFWGPIIVLGEKILTEEKEGDLKDKNLFFMDRAQEAVGLNKLIKDCLAFADIKKRKDERFDVKENATVEAYSSDFKTETIINNISKSGLRIEGHLEGLHKGDLLRLHFQFDKIKKERQLSAKVVWVKLEGDKINEAGLQFVSQKDVYKYLLERAVA